MAKSFNPMHFRIHAEPKKLRQRAKKHITAQISMWYLGIKRGIDPVLQRRVRDRIGMHGTVWIPPIRDVRIRIVESIAWAIDLELIFFVVVAVVHVERDLVQVLLQIRNRVPHRANLFYFLQTPKQN